MTWYSSADVAERTGVEPSYLARLVDLGIVPSEPDRFSPGDVRRVLMTRSLEGAGIPPEDVAVAIRHGALSLDFLDAAGFERFAGLATETFRQVSERTGIPLELLMVVREAIGPHAGQVLYQEADYYCGTVSITARIADHAQSGEVLVTHAVADASKEEWIAVADVGAVELKGVSGPVDLLRAHRA